MKKIIWPGLLVGIVTLVAGMILSNLSMLIPAIASDYGNQNLFRSWQDPLMILFLLYPFVFGLALSWAWNKTKSNFKGSFSQRSFGFGLFVFIIATIPGMFITYTSMPYSLELILAWTLSGLVNAVIAGMILVKLNK